jgi:hypothetical protein
VTQYPKRLLLFLDLLNRDGNSWDSLSSKKGIKIRKIKIFHSKKKDYEELDEFFLLDSNHRLLKIPSFLNNFKQSHVIDRLSEKINPFFLFFLKELLKMCSNPKFQIFRACY